MGDDVDTVCCVYGQIAGAYYGYSGNAVNAVNAVNAKEVDKGVPKELISQLQNRPKLIGQFIENL